MSIGARLKKARRASGLKQEDVAAAARLGISSISEFESGTRQPKTAQLKALADVYGRSIDYFLSDREPAPELVLWREKPVSPKAEELEIRLVTLAEQYHKLEVLCDERRVHSLPIYNESRAVFGPSDARQLAKSVRTTLGLGDRPAAVLLNVLEESCGVKVFHVPFEPAGSAACTCNEESGVSILLNANHNRTQRNSDLAHELFHLLTWNVFRPSSVDATNCDLHNEEMLADLFAGELLIPTDALITAVDIARGDSTKLGPDDFIAIARQFDVPTDMLLRRTQAYYRISDESIKALSLAIERILRSAPRDPETVPVERPIRFRSLADRAYRNAMISTGVYAEFVGISRRDAMKLFAEEPAQDAEVEVANP